MRLLGGKGVRDEREAMLGEVYAPALLDVEATQTLRGLLRARQIDLRLAELARLDIAELPIRRYPDTALLQRAWQLRGVCTVYDGLYVALAESLDAPLLTRDGRLARGLQTADLECVVTFTGD